MRINNVSNVSNSSLKAITNKPTQTNESSFSKALNTNVTKTTTSKTLDFTNMSPREFSQFPGRNLIQYTIIEHSLIELPDGNIDVSGTHIDSAALDKKINYLDLYRKVISSSGGNPYLAETLRIMEQLQGSSV